MNPETTKQNILFITRAHNPNQGGMEKLSYELVETLENNDQVSLELIAYRGQRKLSPLFNFIAPFRALTYIKNADVIHIGDPLLSLTGFLLKFFFSKPVCVTVHGLDISYDNFLYQLYLKLFFRHFDGYFPISAFAKKKLLDKYQPKSTPSVITPGFKDNYYAPNLSRQDLDQLLNKKTDNLFVLMTSGRLVARKGHAWFLANVFPHLPPQTIYLIAGQGPQLNSIKRIINSQNLTDRVFLLGRINEDALKVLYNTADAFIQPNIAVKDDPEGFGLVLLEASSCNLPVFAADIDGIPSAVHSGQNGVLIQSGNKDQWTNTLTQFIQSRHSLKSPRTYTLNNYNWDTRIQDYLSGYRKAQIN
jgi:glycosyltransferase involved in cell wall biosynthesis